MKKTTLMLILFLLLPSIALAGNKLGIVEVQRVIEESDPGEKVMGELTVHFEDMRADLEQERAQVEQLRQELEQQSMVLSDEAQQEMESELQQKIQEFQQKSQSYQARMQQKEQELTDPIYDLLFDVVNDYAEENGYDMVFNTQGSGLIYAQDAMNITDEIIEELNRAWEAQEN